MPNLRLHSCEKDAKYSEAKVARHDPKPVKKMQEHQSCEDSFKQVSEPKYKNSSSDDVADIISHA